MLIASIVRRSRPRACPRFTSGVAPALLLCSIIGCLAPPTVVVEDLLEPLSRPALWIPRDEDLAAAKLARAALIAHSVSKPAISDAPVVDPRFAKFLARLEAMDQSKENESLVPLAIDLGNATLDDPIAYRAKSRELRKRAGLDFRIEARLDRTIDDDPIQLAKRRQFDGWHRLWARTFNAISQPLGSTVITGFVLAPFQLANSVIHYFADFSNEEPLSMTDRQALVLRQDFQRKHPASEIAEELKSKIDRATIRLEETLALRHVRASEVALDAGEPALARYQAEVATRTLVPHPLENRRLRKRIEDIQAKAVRLIEEESRRRLGSLESEPTTPSSRDSARQLARSLLARSSTHPELDQRLSDYRRAIGDSNRGLTQFVLALRQHESGYDVEARERLGEIAALGPAKTRMARHAETLLDDSWQNPYGAFVRLKRSANRQELAWRLAGEWVRRTRYPNLPTPLAYLIDTPTIAITIVLAPLRALTSPWTGTPDWRRAPALAGYRYLRRFPDGAHQREVVDWLYDYESDEERWGRALRLADLMTNFDPDERLELVEKTTEKRLERVDRLDRRDNRASVLKGVAREFPDSDGGRAAGLRARAEVEDASAQHIRITKSFMLENPGVAGPNGLGLNPRLLNDDDTDGELHPDGVLLRGGRLLDILLIAEGADDEDPPELRSRKISKERLSRVAAALNEAVVRNGLIDVDARQPADASRDVYVERAGLGLTDEMDRRPTAESTHVYESLRERYGLVRGRDSILPFDLVFRGSLGDFSLGAFPRWRPPRETPDAFLYR